MRERLELAELVEHFETVVDALFEGELVFFLGAGINLANRLTDQPWHPGGEFLPDGAELAKFLADRFKYPTGY